MFNCAKCNLRGIDGAPVQVVLDTRPKAYPERSYRVKGGREIDGRRGYRTVKQPAGLGYEIVREALWYRPCAGLAPIQVSAPKPATFAEIAASGESELLRESHNGHPAAE